MLQVAKILVIQTAFIGDAVLATGVAEKIHSYFPNAQIDILVRKGNEGLFENHPFIRTIIWNKKKSKYLHLFKLLRSIRAQHYDKVINLQRFAATGMLTAFSGAEETIGFDKNPFSFFFFQKITHHISSAKTESIHEIERNHELIKAFTDAIPAKPKLYPSPDDYAKVNMYKGCKYVCIAPSSVWFTKQYPAEKWVSFINKIPGEYCIYLIGASGDIALCNAIKDATKHSSIINLAGKLSFLESAALMQYAAMNYVNDSAPLHFASAVNAPVTAIYCSTIPSFGFGPLSTDSYIVEVQEQLTCKPCGLHGLKDCPLGHFNCAMHIKDEQLISKLDNDQIS